MGLRVDPIQGAGGLGPRLVAGFSLWWGPVTDGVGVEQR